MTHDVKQLEAFGHVLVSGSDLPIGQLLMRRQMLGFCARTRGGPAEGVRPDIEIVPGRAWCFDCAHRVAIGDHGGSALRVEDGEPLRLSAMEFA